MHLEHVNLTVSDLDRSVAFYSRLLDLRVRWQGATSDGARAAHVGDDRTYLALFEATKDGAVAIDYGVVGLNHFGWVIEDLDTARQHLLDQGLTPHFEPHYEPGRRLYVYDPDGIELELVEYPRATTLDTAPEP
jgi:catechol 2,3-dioxygenase-like lactoylglutathione lyase family enzyme